MHVNPRAISTTGVTSRKLFTEPHCPQRDNS